MHTGDACARRPLSPLCDACAAPAKDWRWLDYEDLVAAHYSGDATGLVGRLAAFARVDAADLEDALACFAPSSKTPDVAPRLAATVDLATRTAEAPSPYAPERHV